MYFIHTGDWLLASVLFILANIGANGSFVFYDALLPHIARDDEIDRVSTAGYALGYLGGGLLLALNLAWLQKPAWFGLPSGENLSESQATLPARLAFVSVAIWWFVFSIPLFRRVPEPKAALESGGAAGRESDPGHAGTAGQHRPRAPPVQAGLPDAPGLPDLQRRHRHDHPDGDDLRRGDRHRSGGDDRLDPDRPVRRHSVLVPLRHAGRQDRRQAVGPPGAARLHADLRGRLLHAHRQPIS